MNYVGLLTKEEKAILCEIITGKEFKELLIGNYDLYERERNRPKQLTIFNRYEDFNYEKILKECILSCKIKK